MTMRMNTRITEDKCEKGKSENGNECENEPVCWSGEISSHLWQSCEPSGHVRYDGDDNNGDDD